MSKRKYLVLARSQRSGGRSGPSPEQMQQMFAAFNAWKEKFKDAILDIGAKLESEGRETGRSWRSKKWWAVS